MKWSKVAIANCILTQGSALEPWASEHVAMSWPKHFGVGHEKIVGDIDRTQPDVRGKSLLTVLRKHQTVVLQHWPHPEWIKELRADSEIRKVLLWVDIEAVPADGYWSPFAQHMQTALRGHRLQGNGMNRFGQPWVDPYEGYAGDGTKKPHAHCVEFWKPGATRAIVGALKHQFQPYIGIADGILVDNCMPRPNFGTASNEPVVTEEMFVRGMKAVHDEMRRAGLGHIWGNATAQQDEDAAKAMYPQLDGRWAEQELVNHANPTYLASIVKDCIVRQEEARRGQHHEYTFNVEPRGYGFNWLNNEQMWKDLAAQLPQPYDDNLGLVTYRSGSAGCCLSPEAIG